MPILCGNDVRSFLVKIISIFYCSGVKSSVKKLKSTTDSRRGLYPNSEALGLALEHYRKTIEIAANVIHETRKRAEDYDQLLDQHSTAVAQTTDSIKLNGLSGYFFVFY